ncbi:hypothetical protein GGS24DRAFT_177164 [Hypoxylon argillaceum]|nr:hypothetical protein GGS24DRAFT_177164 [Hypoxylon argillaceum]
MALLDPPSVVHAADPGGFSRWLAGKGKPFSLGRELKRWPSFSHSRKVLEFHPVSLCPWANYLRCYVCRTSDMGLRVCPRVRITYTHTHIHVHTCCSEGRGGAEHTAGRQLSCWLAGWLVSIASLACMLFGGCLFLIGSEPINHDGAQTLCHFRSSVIPVFRSPLMLGMPAYGIKCKGVTNDGRMEGVGIGEGTYARIYT